MVRGTLLDGPHRGAAHRGRGEQPSFALILSYV